MSSPTDRIIRAIWDGKEPANSAARAQLAADHGQAFADYMVEMITEAKYALERDRAIEALPGSDIERARAASGT